MLTDVDAVADMMVTGGAAKPTRRSIETAFHRFQPHGVSGVVVIEESHLSIHTWPETGYAAMDFYTCGDHTDPWEACEYAAKMLGASSMRTTEVKRGIEAGNGQFTHVVTADAERRDRELKRESRSGRHNRCFGSCGRLGKGPPKGGP